jgi:hypothetical protein
MATEHQITLMKHLPSLPTATANTQQGLLSDLFGSIVCNQNREVDLGRQWNTALAVLVFWPRITADNNEHPPPGVVREIVRIV